MKIIIFISVLAVSLFASALAQENPSPYAVPRAGRQIQERVKEEIKNLRPEAKKNIEEIKNRASEVKTEARTKALDARNATREELEAKKQELRTAAEEKREELKTRVEETRVRVKKEIDAKRIELKDRLRQVRDEQKRKAVERLEEQLNRLNERMMKHFSEVLDRLEKTLVNIKSRTDKAESKGWNVASVRKMIVSAEEAIAAARAAIEAQAAKNYVPEITGDHEKLKVEVGQARQALHDDLKILREKIRLAYEAVRLVATTLAQVPRIDEESAESPSPTP